MHAKIHQASRLSNCLLKQLSTPQTYIKKKHNQTVLFRIY